MAAKGASADVIRANARARSKRYYDKHRAKVLESQRLNFQKPETKEARKVYRAANSEKIRQREKERYETTKAVRNKKMYNSLKADAVRWAKSHENRQVRMTGISSHDVDELLVIQDWSCAICKRPFEDRSKVRRDHCHDTKTPRGLLCHQCNTVEGLIKKMGTTPDEFARRLSDYLTNPTYKLLKRA